MWDMSPALARGARYRSRMASLDSLEVSKESPVHSRSPLDLVHRVSGFASSASEALVPRPIRDIVDRTLLDAACLSRGGVLPVANRLGVDPPAVAAWRSLGIPPEFRSRLATLAVVPDLPGRSAA